MITDFNLKQLIYPLQDWYLQNARTLPWREDPTPYHVWVSEIMLQQTRVEAVKPYYLRFMNALPDIRSLAECPEDQYLKLWEGLGYYSRVRNLHAAACQVMEQFGGRLPEDYQDLLKLKGIGSYTAGAIASQAFHKAVPAVDGNVFRVLTRVTGDDTDISKAAFRTQVEQILKKLMEEEIQNNLNPSVFNQGLMELGATVCVPNGEARCSSCPWAVFCRARLENRIPLLPVKKKAKERRIEERTVLLICDNHKIAIHKRPSSGLLAGLYEFPNLAGHLSEKDVIAFIREIGYSPLRIRRLSDSKHIFSHIEWHMIAYQLLVEEEAFASASQLELRKDYHLFFVDQSEQKKSFAVPSAFAAYKNYEQDER